eukprot:TRINITY_DN9432_c0_g1_i1.p1 TRINITY_DN9432_c0_g1~~TRINITY_DN9432_c0_g1_i1.p1  ORF type:complete len:104 (-),score=7.36 TRINITY_DN9432_c0_g1_i1:61-372(-)
MTHLENVSRLFSYRRRFKQASLSLMLAQCILSCGSASATDETCDREGIEVTRVNPILVHLAYIQLHSSMLLCCNESIRSRALTRKVEVDYPSFVVLHGLSGRT